MSSDFPKQQSTNDILGISFSEDVQNILQDSAKKRLIIIQSFVKQFEDFIRNPSNAIKSESENKIYIFKFTKEVK